MSLDSGKSGDRAREDMWVTHALDTNLSITVSLY